MSGNPNPIEKLTLRLLTMLPSANWLRPRMMPTVT
jgi:hypothetical protein